MNTLTIRDIARTVFLGYNGDGVFVMLACYMDDSGTHSGSGAIVWGGLIGHVDYFEKLDRAWREILASPCDGRPPIDSFHSCRLAAGAGQFAGYSEAERDWTRHNFRQAIVDSTLTAIAFAVSVDDWNKIIVGRVRSFCGDPERWICGEVFGSGCDLAREYNLPISFQFDVGRQTDGVKYMLDVINNQSCIGDVVASIGFLPVNQVSALQAADMVAHQTYQHFLKTLDNPGIEPDAHMRRLMEDSYDWGVKTLSKEGLRVMANSIETQITNHPLFS